jgi:tartrate dehydrogenase/decarboxylase/D-malate dehydrogenase
VIVASNMVGDMLSDEAAVIAGGVGLAPGANLNPDRTFPSMFEPIHGSAPDIAGKGIANPIATILAGQMMVYWLGDEAGAYLILKSVEQIVAEGQIRTYDMGGSAKTLEMAKAVAEHLESAAV